ncbi:hypothetical protein ACQKL5_15625 [Peribacillus sp. NPDC097675]|uniref:hypothetical protein n=1 Tax=Peribacillus sp. NPDC097675 TaxID=3390618 RepID=UPI003D046A0B
MSEGNERLLDGQKRIPLLFSSVQDKQRLEELIGDLIRHVAKTHVQTKVNEDELHHLKMKVAQLESHNKYLYEHNEKLEKRVTHLEQNNKSTESSYLQKA